jgi:hypothetical protein
MKQGGIRSFPGNAVALGAASTRRSTRNAVALRSGHPPESPGGVNGPSLASGTFAPLTGICPIVTSLRGQSYHG